MNGYKCTYIEVNRQPGTKGYGQLIERSRKFKTFSEAVSYSRLISNTNVDMVGKPVIFLGEPTE